MLGLGTNIIRSAGVKTIVTDNLVLNHGYALSPVQPLSDGAASFNGTSDYIAINAKPVDTADGTYCWWSNSTQTASQTIFSHGGNDIGTFHANFGSTGNPLLYIQGNLYQYWDDTGLADDGKWHHWALVVDVDDMTACKLYCDGVVIPQAARSTSGTVTSYGNMELGRWATSNEFDGYMCNFGVWSSHLTQPQIKSIMNKNYADLTASETSDLVSWWNLDSTVDSATEGSSFVYDNHHGGTDTLSGELITNGTLDTSSGWVIGDFTMSGTATVTTDGGNQYIQQTNMWDNNAKDGKLLKLSWEVVENSDSIQLKIGGFSGAEFSASTLDLTSTVGSHSMYIEVDGTGNADAIVLWINHTAGKTLTIDNISLKEVQGNTGKLS